MFGYMYLIIITILFTKSNISWTPGKKCCYAEVLYGMLWFTKAKCNHVSHFYIDIYIYMDSDLPYLSPVMSYIYIVYIYIYKTPICNLKELLALKLHTSTPGMFLPLHFPLEYFIELVT